MRPTIRGDLPPRCGKPRACPVDTFGVTSRRLPPSRMAERKSFLLRIDPQLWAEIESWAQDELRSVNGQIEFLLRDAVLRRRGRTAAARVGRTPSADAEDRRGKAV